MLRPGLTVRTGLAAGFALVGLAAAASAAAATERVALDSRRSHAEFSVRVLWVLSVSGRFGKVDGAVDIDRFRSQAVVDARIDANAVEMGNDSYEDWVKSDEFFDVAEYPEIHFVSESFPLQRIRNGGVLKGALTIRGVERPATFAFQPSECERPAYDCPIRVEGSIRRSAFGMKAHRGTLSDKVELRFEVYAVPSATRLAP